MNGLSRGNGTKRLFNVRELADYIGTSQLNVYQMVSKNKIPFVKIGRSTRFDIKEIDGWIDRKKQASRVLVGEVL